MRAAVLMLVALVGCSTDPGAADPYSLASAGVVCPGPFGAAQSACNLVVCDRGAQSTERFVTLESCAGGARFANCGVGQRAGLGGASQHPDFAACFTGRPGAAALIRDVDVAAAIRQCQADAGARPDWCPP